MKEFLATGALIAALAVFGSPAAEPCGDECVPESVKYGVSDGFPPRETVTSPTMEAAFDWENLLPDFGSEAYL